jgi:hypothetical protein
VIENKARANRVTGGQESRARCGERFGDGIAVFGGDGVENPQIMVAQIYESVKSSLIKRGFVAAVQRISVVEPEEERRCAH